MLQKALWFLLIVFLTVACQEGVKKSDEPLTSLDSLNLQLVSQENVVLFASPPMIPVDHPFVVGEDMDMFQNGGDDCLDCHNDPDDDEATLTLHPERHNCVQCHIQDTEDFASEEDFKVENTFEKKTKF